LSTSYKASGGESWSLVAMQTTGNDTDADAIRRANPGLSAPLREGDTVNIPDTPSTASSSPGNPSIVVLGVEIQTFNDFEMARSIDAIGKASFTVPNEKEMRELFVPVYYPQIVISIGDKVRFTGRCNSRENDNGSDIKTSNVTAFSLPGILEISGPPIEAFPLEYKKWNLQGIASDLCWKQGISTVFEEDSGGWFKRVDFTPWKSSLQFLSDLAKERGFVVSDNENGELVFWTGKPSGNPVGSYRKGTFPCTNVSMSIDDERFYSSVSGYVTGRTHRQYRGKSYTIQNNYITDIIRPHLEAFQDIDEGELPAAVNALAGRMFSDVVSVNVELATWYDDNGNLFEPNTTIMVQSEEDDIPEPYEFMISTVTLSKTDQKLTASLNCVIPGVFSGEIPERMPWQK
jgi:hypothetical protein